MHGLTDITIPRSLETAYGPSPDFDGLMSKHGSYFEDKETLLQVWADFFGCSEGEFPYLTGFDGENDFQCYQRICPDERNIVKCFGNWDHIYPVGWEKIYVASEVAFQFMMSLK